MDISHGIPLVVVVVTAPQGGAPECPRTKNCTVVVGLAVSQVFERKVACVACGT